ncbi:MAG TPA: type II toxin-antitoxin system VapC family toxin [Vicinamibacterales bacterium]|nr:type II toxin-antitoxin system VapC family toxin [Vicinamibacterales bacterium]
MAATSWTSRYCRRARDTAPLLWRSEFRNVLSGAVHRKALSLESAAAIASQAEAQFTGREFSVNTAHVLTLAATSGCSPYDCEFVALAIERGVPLVTNDREVLKAFPAIAIPIDRYGSI